jgi:hypothetical protein
MTPIRSDLSENTETERQEFSNEADSSAFSLSLVNDRRNCADHSRKLSSNFVSLGYSNLAKKYSEGKLYVVLPLESSLCDCIRYLVFFAVGNAFHDVDRSSPAESLDIRQIDADFGSDWDDKPVLRGVAKFVNCKEQVTPTLVRLVTSKEPFDFFRESLASTVYATFEISSGFAEGEVDIIDRHVGELCDSDSGQIKRRSQVLNSADCAFCKAHWKRFAEFELVPFVNAIGIRLNDMFAWCSLEIEPSAPFKIGKTFVSPLES